MQARSCYAFRRHSTLKQAQASTLEDSVSIYNMSIISINEKGEPEHGGKIEVGMAVGGGTKKLWMNILIHKQH